VSYADATRKQWEELVRVALALSERGYDDRIRQLAGEVGVTFGVLKRKCDAIRNESKSAEDIIAQGQGKTLSAYAKQRKKYDEKTKMLRIRIPASLYDAIQNPRASVDQEEPVMTRLHRLIGIRTWTEFFEFDVAMYANATDEEILHAAGEHPGKKKRR